MEDKEYFALYGYIMQIGQNEHSVQLFEKYSDSEGLQESVIKIVNTRFSEIIKQLKKYLTKSQITSLKIASKDKDYSAIYHPNGKYLGQY